MVFDILDSNIIIQKQAILSYIIETIFGVGTYVTEAVLTAAS